MRGLLLLGVTACGPLETELPVVARGRYVEIATMRDEPICGGTVAYFDRFIEAGFALIGETPPDRVFVRYEWLEFDEDDPAVGGGRARIVDDGILIRSDAYLVEEHELAHAVHLQAWPGSNEFLYEGFAVLLDPKRIFYQYAWPPGVTIDQVVGAPDLAVQDYAYAWFLVSQVVSDHGFEGLGELWRAIPPGSSAVDVREAYETIFERPIDALIEPNIVETPDGPYELPRYPCNFALCLAPAATPWNENLWSASGPTDCEQDPDAIGPDHREYGYEHGEVWRHHVIEMTSDALEVETSATVGASLAACSLICSDSQIESGQVIGPASIEDGSSWPGAGRHRVEVRSEIDALPTAAPGQLVIRRSAE